MSWRSIIFVIPAQAGTQDRRSRNARKASLCVYPGEPTQRHALRRRHQRSLPPSLATPIRRRARLCARLRRAPAGARRAPPDHDRCDPARKAGQEVAAGLEAGADRTPQSRIGGTSTTSCSASSRPVRAGDSPWVPAFRGDDGRADDGATYSSFPRKREPSTVAEAGAEIAGTCFATSSFQRKRGRRIETRRSTSPPAMEAHPCPHISATA